MSGRRMNIRKCKDGSYCLRFYHAHEDQIETIQLALDHARLEGGSDFDTVALDRICMAYLSTFPHHPAKDAGSTEEQSK
jgi:hypothetical protein